MQRRLTMRPLFILLMVLTGLAPSSRADGDIRTVALSGQRPPGAGEQESFAPFFDFDFNNAGQVSFLSGLLGPDIDAQNQFGIWDDSEGSLSLVVRGGQQPPGAAHAVVLNALFAPSIDEQGQTFFAGSMSDPDTNGFIEPGVWGETPLGLQLFARSGDPVTGLPDGFAFGGFSPEIQPTAQGIAIHAGAHLHGEGSFTTAGRLNAQGEFDLTVITSDQAPGYPEGATLARLNYNGARQEPLRFNSRGQAAFVGTVQYSGDRFPVDFFADRSDQIRPLPGQDQFSPGDRLPDGLFTNRSGRLELLARVGDPAPGVPGGDEFFHFDERSITLNDDGEIAFVASLAGTLSIPGTDPSGVGIWSDAGGGELRLIAQRNTTAPGLPEGTLLSSLGSPSFGAPGQVYFTSVITGGGYELTDFENGVWVSEDGGDPELIYFTGDPSLGKLGEFGLEGVFGFQANALGQMVFRSRLGGPGVDDSNDVVIWARSLDGVLNVIAREGDQIDVNDDPAIEDLRTIDSLLLTRSRFNDRGEFAFTAELTDGTTGLFVSSVVAIPEPSSSVLAGVALVGLMMSSRSGRQLNRALPGP